MSEASTVVKGGSIGTTLASMVDDLGTASLGIDGYLADTPEGIATKVREWFTEAEDLYGQGSLSKAPLYVKHAYKFRDIMCLYAAKEGKDWKRGDFMKLFTFMIANTSSIFGGLEPHKLAKAVGVCEMLRATMKEGTNQLVFPNAPPEADFFVGSLTWPAILALGKLVKIEKDNATVDTYEWAEPGYKTIAFDVYKKLKDGVTYSSQRYVNDLIDKQVRAMRESDEAVNLAKMGEDAKEAHRKSEEKKLEEKNDAEFAKIRNSLTDQVKKMGLSPDNVRDRLVRVGAIPPVGVRDVLNTINDTAVKPIVMAAVTQADFTADHFAAIFANPSNRSAALKALALVLTHQDVASLFNELNRLYAVTPESTRDIPKLINMFGAAATKFKRAREGHGTGGTAPASLGGQDSKQPAEPALEAA